MSINTNAMANEVFHAEAVPNTSGAVGFSANPSGVSNVPQATGLITYPQSPSGTSVTNTTRTLSATQAYMAAKLNAQNQSTSPPPN